MQNNFHRFLLTLQLCYRIFLQTSYCAFLTVHLCWHTRYGKCDRFSTIWKPIHLKKNVYGIKNVEEPLKHTLVVLVAYIMLMLFSVSFQYPSYLFPKMFNRPLNLNYLVCEVICCGDKFYYRSDCNKESKARRITVCKKFDLEIFMNDFTSDLETEYGSALTYRFRKILLFSFNVDD